KAEEVEKHSRGSPELAQHPGHRQRELAEPFRYLASIEVNARRLPCFPNRPPFTAISCETGGVHVRAKASGGMDESRKRARTGSEAVAVAPAAKAPELPKLAGAAAATTKISELEVELEALKEKVDALQAKNESQKCEIEGLNSALQWAYAAEDIPRTALARAGTQRGIRGCDGKSSKQYEAEY
ncbi:hypothetical protein THAOC_20952, partial [Thalassiosira oceanica]